MEVYEKLQGGNTYTKIITNGKKDFELINFYSIFFKVLILDYI